MNHRLVLPILLALHSCERPAPLQPELVVDMNVSSLEASTYVTHCREKGIKVGDLRAELRHPDGSLALVPVEEAAGGGCTHWLALPTGLGSGPHELRVAAIVRQGDDSRALQRTLRFIPGPSIHPATIMARAGFDERGRLHAVRLEAKVAIREADNYSLEFELGDGNSHMETATPMQTLQPGEHQLATMVPAAWLQFSGSERELHIRAVRLLRNGAPASRWEGLRPLARQSISTADSSPAL
jgi:hypothetical protein